jgi:hypothetical protein
MMVIQLQSRLFCHRALLLIEASDYGAFSLKLKDCRSDETFDNTYVIEPPQAELVFDRHIGI